MRQEALEIDLGHLDNSICRMVLRSHVSHLQMVQAVPQTQSSDATIGTASNQTAMVELEVHDTGFSKGSPAALSSNSSVLRDLLSTSLACDMTQNFRQIGL